MAEQSQNHLLTRIAMTSDKEVELLRGAFEGNEELLKNIRLLAYGLPLSESDKKTIWNTFSDGLLKRAFRRKIYPIFEEDMPDISVNSLADFWYGIENNVNGKDRDTIYQNIESKEIVKNMFGKMMNILVGLDDKPIDLSYVGSPVSDPLGIQLIARNLYIRSINEGINVIKMIVDKSKETSTIIKKKQAQNSSK